MNTTFGAKILPNVEGVLMFFLQKPFRFSSKIFINRTDKYFKRLLVEILNYFVMHYHQSNFTNKIT